MTHEEFSAWLETGFHRFDLEGYKGGVYFHPEKKAEIQSILDNLTVLQFILVDDEGFPTTESPSRSMREAARGVLSQNGVADQARETYEAWSSYPLSVIHSEKSKTWDIVASAPGGKRKIILSRCQTQEDATFQVNNRDSLRKNDRLRLYESEFFAQDIARTGATPETIEGMAEIPEAPGEPIWCAWPVEKLMELYMGRIPVRLGDVIVFEDGIAMVAIDWDSITENVIWMQDWSAGDNIWMRNVASGYGQNKWKAWKGNYRKNKKNILRGISDLRGSHKGKPVILIGNGPSLAMTARHIKPHPDLKVVTCNRGMLFMDKLNASNGGANVVDYYMLADYEGRKDWYPPLSSSRADVLSYVFADPGVASFTDPKRFYWYVLSNYIPECKEEVDLCHLDWLCAGTSVSTPMLHFAYYVLEADPIILVGFDHAYTSGFKYPGVPMNASTLAGRHPTDSFRIVRDVGGGPTISDDMLMLQKMQNDAIPFFQIKTDRRFVNATGAGALSTDWWETCSIQEAYAWFIEKSVPAPGKPDMCNVPQGEIWWDALKNKLMEGKSRRMASALLR